MDPRERTGDFTEALRAALDGRQAKMWTSGPGIIESFDVDAQTAVVQPAIQARQSYPDGSVQLVNLPLLLDCPVQFPSGGGVTFTFPVAQGDECWVVWASRCIDAWWQSGGIQPPMEARMHDLSDGGVLLGFKSKPNVISDVSTTAAELRSDDGSTKVSLNPTAQTVTVNAPGGIAMNGNLVVNGNLTATGDVDLGGTSGPAVARVGDTVSGGVITAGSSRVKAS